MKIPEQSLRRHVDAAEQAHPPRVEAGKIDILVMGTVGRTGLPRLVMGNTAT